MGYQIYVDWLSGGLTFCECYDMMKCSSISGVQFVKAKRTICCIIFHCSADSIHTAKQIWFAFCGDADSSKTNVFI